MMHLAQVHSAQKGFDSCFYCAKIIKTTLMSGLYYLVTRTGIDLHFRQERKQMVASVQPSAATVHRTVAFGSVRFPACAIIKTTLVGGLYYLVTRTGIEPMLPP